jgi:hypothetical protein
MMPLLPDVSARVRAMVKEHGHFIKMNRSYRLEIEGLGGLALEWEERGTSGGIYRRSAWVLRFAPQAYLDFQALTSPSYAKPFNRIDLGVSAGSLLPQAGWSRRARRADPASKSPGYFEDDPRDIDAFMTEIEAWFTEAFPLARGWLDDPIPFLRLLAQPGFYGRPEAVLGEGARLSAFRPHLSGHEPLFAILAASAGQQVEAHKAVAALEAVDGPAKAWAERSLRAIRSLHPELA